MLVPVINHLYICTFSYDLDCALPTGTARYAYHGPEGKRCGADLPECNIEGIHKCCVQGMLLYNDPI